MQCRKIVALLAFLRDQTEAIGRIGQVDGAQQMIVLIADARTEQALEEPEKACHDILLTLVGVLR